MITCRSKWLFSRAITSSGRSSCLSIVKAITTRSAAARSAKTHPQEHCCCQYNKQVPYSVTCGKVGCRSGRSKSCTATLHAGLTVACPQGFCTLTRALAKMGPQPHFRRSSRVNAAQMCTLSRFKHAFGPVSVNRSTNPPQPLKRVDRVAIRNFGKCSFFRSHGALSSRERLHRPRLEPATTKV